MLDATPLLRLHARARLRRLARLDAVATQRRVLAALVRRARDTAFGRDHGFDAIRAVEDYQRRVPLRGYEDFWRIYWQPRFPTLGGTTWPGHIPYLAVTSGTSTGRTKYIPVSREMVRSNKRSGVDVLVHHVTNRPESRVLGGRNFMLGGTVDLRDEGEGVASGDLTGIARRELPVWGRPYVFPSRELAREADWERRIEQVGRASLTEPIRTVAGTPSWLLLYFERLAAMTGRRRLVEIYPELELVSHGGLAFAPYRHVFAEWLEGSRAELREVYPASEGFVALADRGPGEGLRMQIDNGLFFEFVPVEHLDRPAPDRHWLGTAETGRDYALAVTSNAGVWSYLLGDTVRLVDLNPPRLLVTGRTSYFLSAFGEHLSGGEIEAALVGAAEAAGREVNEYSVGPLYPDRADGRGRHAVVVEFRAGAIDDAGLAAFASDLDARLADANDDYRTHRARDFGMATPLVVAVASGTFAEWMRRRGRLGGQNKVPRVILDEDLLADLLALAETRTIARSPREGDVQ
jgi:hypothetical protein